MPAFEIFFFSCSLFSLININFWNVVTRLKQMSFFHVDYFCEFKYHKGSLKVVFYYISAWKKWSVTLIELINQNAQTTFCFDMTCMKIKIKQIPDVVT